MTALEINPHPLLDKPSEVSLAYRQKLVDAYHERVESLRGGFTSAADVLRPAFPVTLYYYSDNGGRLNDTAPMEIVRFLKDSANIVSTLSGIEKPEIIYDDTLAQSWITSGFELAQTTRYGLSGVGNVTFLNCAPRLDERGAEGNTTNRGEPVYIGVLPNGHVITANSRYNFCFFRDMVERGDLEIHEAHVQPDGTQFRSRDIFTVHALVLANLLTQNNHSWKSSMTLEERRELLEAIGYVDTSSVLSLEEIPQLKQFTVANMDVHGNIKLNTRLSELEPSVVEQLKADEFIVNVNGHTLRASFSERMFDRAEGQAGLSSGSSGSSWVGAAYQDGFLEISIIGDDAAAALHLEPGDLKRPIEVIIPGIIGANDNFVSEPAVQQREHLVAANG